MIKCLEFMSLIVFIISSEWILMHLEWTETAFPDPLKNPDACERVGAFKSWCVCVSGCIPSLRTL